MILITDPDVEFRARAAAWLGEPRGMREAIGLDDARDHLEERSGPAVVLLGPGLGTEAALDFAEEARRAGREVSVLLVTRKFTASLLRAALRAGVQDVLPHSVTAEQLREAVDRADSLSRDDAQSDGPPARVAGKVITVFSAKGGCGKSFLSSNLAMLLAQRTGWETAVLDLDIESGDMAIMLRLMPSRTIWDVAQNLDAIDPEQLGDYLTPYKSKVSLLAAPLEPGLGDKISPEAIRRIVQLLRSRFAFVVVDGPGTFTEHVVAALDLSDECVLVTTMDVPSIKNMKLSLQTLDLLGIPRNRTRVVLNRADSRVGLRASEVEKAIGTNVDVQIPSSIEVPLSINRGTPLAVATPGSPVVAALTGLVQSLGVSVEPQPAPAGRKQLVNGLMRRITR